MAEISSTYLNIYMKHSCTEALGPGKRYALWVQGCPFRCKGCLAPDTLPLEGGERVLVSDLAKEIIQASNDLDGITISGGEPFLQAAPLSELIRLVRSEWNAGVIVYSGFTFQQLSQINSLSQKYQFDLLLNQVDLLIDGQFIENKNDGLSLRGSANQQVIALTERYQDEIGIYGKQGRKVEMVIKGQAYDLIGVPPINMLDLINSPKT